MKTLIYCFLFITISACENSFRVETKALPPTNNPNENTNSGLTSNLFYFDFNTLGQIDMVTGVPAVPFHTSSNPSELRRISSYSRTAWARYIYLSQYNNSQYDIYQFDTVTKNLTFVDSGASSYNGNEGVILYKKEEPVSGGYEYWIYNPATPTPVKLNDYLNLNGVSENVGSTDYCHPLASGFFNCSNSGSNGRNIIFRSAPNIVPSFVAISASVNSGAYVSASTENTALVTFDNGQFTYLLKYDSFSLVPVSSQQHGSYLEPFHENGSYLYFQVNSQFRVSRINPVTGALTQLCATSSTDTIWSEVLKTSTPGHFLVMGQNVADSNQTDIMEVNGSSCTYKSVPYFSYSRLALNNKFYIYDTSTYDFREIVLGSSTASLVTSTTLPQLLKSKICLNLSLPTPCDVDIIGFSVYSDNQFIKTNKSRKQRFYMYARNNDDGQVHYFFGTISNGEVDIYNSNETYYRFFQDILETEYLDAPNMLELNPSIT